MCGQRQTALRFLQRRFKQLLVRVQVRLGVRCLLCVIDTWANDVDS